MTTAAGATHGVALKPAHYDDARTLSVQGGWYELMSEGFLRARGGRAFELIETLRARGPLALHGTQLSIGSIDPLDEGYLADLADLVARVEPRFVSDHLAWVCVDGWRADLCPLPYTREALEHVRVRVQQVQDRLGCRLLLENPSSYLRFRHAEMQEWEFLTELTRTSGCGILLDLNNVYVSCRNHRQDPRAYLAGLPGAAIAQYHLAGHGARGRLLVDTHSGPVPAAVWELYDEALHLFGERPTIVEWDHGEHDLETLLAESYRATARGTGLRRAA